MSKLIIDTEKALTQYLKGKSASPEIFHEGHRVGDIDDQLLFFVLVSVVSLGGPGMKAQQFDAVVKITVHSKASEAALFDPHFDLVDDLMQSLAEIPTVRAEIKEAFNSAEKVGYSNHVATDPICEDGHTEKHHVTMLNYKFSIHRKSS